MPDDDPTSYTLTELCDLADVTPRTVRYYIQQGLLRSPDGAGPQTRYDESYLWRLRLTRQLQREHLPLAEIRKRLAALADDEVRGLVGGPPTAIRESAADYIRTVLESRGIPGSHAPAPGAPSASPASRAFQPARRSFEIAPEAMALRAAMTAPLAGAVPLAGAAPAAGAAPVDPGSTSTSPDRSQWDRVSLTPDVELHIRRPLSRNHNRRVDRLISIARQLLEEVTP